LDNSTGYLLLTIIQNTDHLMPSKIVLFESCAIFSAQISRLIEIAVHDRLSGVFELASGGWVGVSKIMFKDQWLKGRLTSAFDLVGTQPNRSIYLRAFDPLIN
jgi:hypothetical protein